ncbi:hypothetical protein EIZ47_02760 [Chryseobacterium lacus]|uniref:Uncharacterized protein n=1 Tax=Chryseobacterium lacus TaxID=2058346 RepID=A0A368N0C0_9FLAO|nr:hypothetical protein [Chryseobacterium lacus]RCU43967.1 hypothetical protein DQ356_02800 [Chryseobacterium lacus]RST28896.1 hypothetical protein EIZ47_02760 [Chryseobacterium lacus]
MKKLITLLALLLFCVYSNAQTAEQTIDWLNSKKTDIRPLRSVYHYDISHELISINFSTEGILFAYKYWFGDKYISIDDKIAWKNITEINIDQEFNDIIIKTGLTSKGKNRYLKLYIGGKKDLADRFSKALTHMATLKGAKLIDEDLF